MSVDRTAIICRGFEIDRETWENLDDDFYDMWGINFNMYSDRGPYLIGYRIKTCDEGELHQLDSAVLPTDGDNELIAACRSAGLEIGPIKTYFGVAVW